MARVDENTRAKKRTAQREKLRAQARRIFGKSLELIDRELAQAIAGGKRIPLKELAKVAELAGKYGVGTQHERETRTTETRRYVVALPRRQQQAAASILQTAANPGMLGPGEELAELVPSDAESGLTPGDTPGV